jgi:hypothetical protein
MSSVQSGFFLDARFGNKAWQNRSQIFRQDSAPPTHLFFFQYYENIRPAPIGQRLLREPPMHFYWLTCEENRQPTSICRQADH